MNPTLHRPLLLSTFALFLAAVVLTGGQLDAQHVSGLRPAAQEDLNDPKVKARLEKIVREQLLPQVNAESTVNYTETNIANAWRKSVYGVGVDRYNVTVEVAEDLSAFLVIDYFKYVLPVDRFYVTHWDTIPK